MSTFGYYNRPNYKLGQIENTDEIRQSIKSMQRFAGLKETGRIDKDTKKLIETPRCGLPDMSRHMNTRKRRYTLQGSRWHKTVSNQNEKKFD